jgi:hypothetical protein
VHGDAKWDNILVVPAARRRPDLWPPSMLLPVPGAA